MNNLENYMVVLACMVCDDMSIGQAVLILLGHRDGSRRCVVPPAYEDDKGNTYYCGYNYRKDSWHIFVVRTRTTRHYLYWTKECCKWFRRRSNCLHRLTDIADKYGWHRVR